MIEDSLLLKRKENIQIICLYLTLVVCSRSNNAIRISVFEYTQIYYEKNNVYRGAVLNGHNFLSLNTCMR